MSSVDVTAYLKMILAELHALRREQLQMVVRIDDISQRLAALHKQQGNTGTHTLPKA